MGGQNGGAKKDALSKGVQRMREMHRISDADGSQRVHPDTDWGDGLPLHNRTLQTEPHAMLYPVMRGMKRQET